MRIPRYGHLRLELRPRVGDALLRVGIEYDPPGPSPLALLLGLGCVRVQLGADAADIGRAGLLPNDLFPRQRFHPWRDWFLPWSALRRLLARPPVPLDWLPAAPHGWAGCYFIGGAHIDAPALVRPPGDRFFSYSVLPVFERRADALEARARLEVADRVIRDLGGCAYVSGATGYDASRWRAHLGRRAMPVSSGFSAPSILPASAAAGASLRRLSGALHGGQVIWRFARSRKMPGVSISCAKVPCSATRPSSRT